MIVVKTDLKFGPFVALHVTGISNEENFYQLSRKMKLLRSFPVPFIAGRLQYQTFADTADAINSHSGAARF
jgi:hypothetical protein